MYYNYKLVDKWVILIRLFKLWFVLQEETEPDFNQVFL